MTEFAADMEATTSGEQQTACHFAARNDACAALKMLMKLGCDYLNARDYKERTPLQLAAELGQYNRLFRSWN